MLDGITETRRFVEYSADTTLVRPPVMRRAAPAPETLQPFDQWRASLDAKIKTAKPREEDQPAADPKPKSLPPADIIALLRKRGPMFRVDIWRAFPQWSDTYVYALILSMIKAGQIETAHWKTRGAAPVSYPGDPRLLENPIYSQALQTLAATDGLSTSDLAETMGISKDYARDILNYLRDKGHVKPLGAAKWWGRHGYLWAATDDGCSATAQSTKGRRQGGRIMPEQLAAFIRTWIAPPPPVAKKAVARYDVWKPTKETPECPF